VPCVLAGLAGGAAYFGSMELDATKPIMVRALPSARVIHRSSFPVHRVSIPSSFLAARPWVAWACADIPPADSRAHNLFLYLGTGYLIGPIIGSTLWRVTHRRTMALIEARDREFHQHIVRNRVDPRAQSATNPVPDFYGEKAPELFSHVLKNVSSGEKIGSLHQYRQVSRDSSITITLILRSTTQWLRDQARYKRKSQWPEDQL